jgi:hypothetical protein
VTARSLKKRLEEIRWVDSLTKQKDQLSPGQIAGLLQLAETWGAATKSRAPPVAPIRDRLSDLSRNLRRAARDLERMRVGAGNSTSLRETYNRLLMAASEAEELEHLQSAEAHLAALVGIVEAAKNNLPRQTRHSTDARFVVERIWGVVVANQPQTDDPDVLRAVEQLNTIAGGHGEVARPRKPLTLTPSSSPGSAFREICGAVLEEMTGTKDADPERALKDFIKRRKARRDVRSG